MGQLGIKKTISLLYDGECYICKQFVKYVALRKQYDVHIYNARECSDLIHVLQQQGYDINHGMILITPDGIFVGEQAATHIDYLIHGKTWVEKQLLKLSHYKLIAYPAYKIGKAVRRLIFWLQGKRKMTIFK